MTKQKTELTLNPLTQMQVIQTLQREMDEAKKKQRFYTEQVRSLAQKIPELIRNLKL